jgi:hypothetical protein
MPIIEPVLDDRNYEQILEEALRRIPVYTPEWTNYGIESDPGVTIVQLFAFLTESLLYRANRVPKLNRLKFLQLLKLPLLPAAAASGLVAIQNERGPVAQLILEQGVIVSAGNVSFVTRDAVNVLPVQGVVYYKRPIPSSDPRYETYRAKYEAVLAAQLAERSDAEGLPFPAGDEFEALGVQPVFYEPTQIAMPTRGDPNPVFDLLNQPLDRALYLALIAPQGVCQELVRQALANAVLSIGIVPAADGEVPVLSPQQVTTSQDPTAGLVFEIADASAHDAQGQPLARYTRLKAYQAFDVFNASGIVQVELPGAAQLQTWSFEEPLEEGSEDFPPRIEDEELAKRLVTWIRMRLPQTESESASGAAARDYRLTWVGINAARAIQVVPVFNEYLGLGSGEPDQTTALANLPPLPTSMRLVVEGLPDPSGATTWENWRLTDDLLAAGPDERVFTLDPEAGVIRFGDGLNGYRPPFGRRILASYEYGGGPQGNVGIGAINASRDSRLQGGYTISNPVPTSGGARGETPEEGERRIPLVLRHRDRLVTQQDFRDITRRTPGVSVGRVEALPLFLPSNPDLEAPGVVSVMVIPSTDPVTPLWPAPDRDFLRRVCNHLDPRRLVTTEIYVRGPIYVSVYLSVGIRVKAGFFPDKVEQEVEQQLQYYLSALPPYGPEGTGWPLKKALQRKDLEAVATRVSGVEYVENLEMGIETPQDIAEYLITGLQLPRLVGVSVRQGSAESLEAVFAPAGQAPSTTGTVPIPVSRATC